MPLNIPFCTISSVTTTELGNDTVADGTVSATHTLTITSDDPVLYPITPADFRITGAIQTGYQDTIYTDIQGLPEIEQIELIQNGAEVDVVVTLVNSFAMNDQNQIINFCIDGHPTISTTVNGVIFNVTTP